MSCHCGFVSYEQDQVCPVHGEATYTAPPVDQDLAALRRQYYELLGRVGALEAEVYRRRKAPSSLATLSELKKAREEADEKAQKDKETEVHVDAQDWERSWLRS
jgi:hypothetical protein